MAGKPAVNVVITGDTKGLEKALHKSSGAVSSFGSTALGVFGGMALTAGVGVAIDAVQKLGGFVLDGVGKLDELGDATGRLDAMFKGLGDTATATDLSKFGVDKGEAANSALAVAKMAKALKLTGPQVRKITPNLQEMAAQLASLGDGDPVKQADLLAKALAGNAKAAKALGVSMPKGGTAMENYAALMKGLAPQLDKATSGQASLADVGERWDATLANLQLQLAGFLEKLAPVVSMLLDNLMPVLQDLVDNVGPLVAEVFGTISEAISGFLENGGAEMIADVFGRISAIFSELIGFIVENVVPVFADLAAGIAETLAPILEKLATELLPALEDVFHDLLPVLEDVWGFIGDTVVPLLVDGLFPILGKVLGLILDLAVAFLKKLGPAIRTMADAFKKLMEWLQPVFEMLGNIAGAAGDALGAIGGFVGIHAVPGAPAAATRGAPATFGASGGIHVTVNTGVGDPVAIGRTVARYLGAYTGRGGSLA